MQQDSLIKTHTIHDMVKILGDVPQDHRGLHVHLSKNKFEKIPVTYPFRGDNCSFLLILRGTLKVQLNLITYHIHANEMITVKPQTVIHILEMSFDLETVVTSFTMDFMLTTSFKGVDFNYLDFFTTNSISKIKLSREEREVTIALSKLLAKHNRADEATIPFRADVINHTFSLLVYHFGSIFKTQYPSLESDLSRNEEMTLRFLKILDENFKTQRSVQFYAEILCVTAGHLSKLLKEVSGKTASQLIEEAVIMEAKLLLHNSALSIAEVAFALQFSDQSFFGKYFKKNTGVSPTVFRKTMK